MSKFAIDESAVVDLQRKSSTINSALPPHNRSFCLDDGDGVFVKTSERI